MQVRVSWRELWYLAFGAATILPPLVVRKPHSFVNTTHTYRTPLSSTTRAQSRRLADGGWCPLWSLNSTPISSLYYPSTARTFAVYGLLLTLYQRKSAAIGAIVRFACPAAACCESAATNQPSAGTDASNAPVLHHVVCRVTWLPCSKNTPSQCNPRVRSSSFRQTIGSHRITVFTRGASSSLLLHAMDV